MGELDEQIIKYIFDFTKLKKVMFVEIDAERVVESSPQVSKELNESKEQGKEDNQTPKK